MASCLLHLIFWPLFAVSEAIFVITSALKDECGKPPTEGFSWTSTERFACAWMRLCGRTADDILTLFIMKGLLRIRRLVRLKPPTDF
ncbi:hypothetical protein RND71_006132 [Anisodus tanguticus]|uniref:Secreted protein n=1 Tax=Anisodus tanguticus TaxID=243964 RepID=A0AAE1STD4_9SOLA|nr:hypothetical protein RND71_006132 [Anisodus tanguticus]